MGTPFGFIKFHTLKLLNEEPSQGVIYPILHEIKEKGPSRKYYNITDEGREEFKVACQKLMETFNALFE